MQFISNVKQIPSELLNYDHNHHNQHSRDNKKSWYNNILNLNNKNDNNIDDDRDINSNINIQKDNKINNNIENNKYKTNKSSVMKVSSRLHERIKEGLDSAISSSDITIHGERGGGGGIGGILGGGVVLYKDQFQIVNEVSCFDGVFPVDIMIYRNNQIVAMLEIDGPHHYR